MNNPLFSPEDQKKSLKYIDDMAGKSVLVIGDIMLDCFVYGDVKRVSPESPVPVLSVHSEDTMPGGAGNVAVNLAALGINAQIISVTGHDKAGETLKTLLTQHDVDINGVTIDQQRPTTQKTRYVGRNQHLLRVDEEIVKPVSKETEATLLEHVKQKLKNVQAIILSDYSKGVLTETLIQNVITLAREHNVPVLVDPKKTDYTIYNGATFLTPNKTELSAVTGLLAASNTDIETAGQKLLETVNVDAVICTRSEDGISIVMRNKDPVHIKHKIHEVFDVSGAGDTVIAVLSASIAANTDIVNAVKLANIAGGLVVSKIGTSCIDKNELKNAIETGQVNPQEENKAFEADINNWNDAKEQIKQWKSQGLKVGFTNGCFDILHFGHVSYLARAREKCDRLVIGLNHDKSVKILKGPERPVNDQNARASVIGALGVVDMVVFFGAENAEDDNTPCDVLNQIQPDIIFKGGDYTIDQLPEAQIVLAYGGEVEIMPLYEGHSTTAIIEKTRNEAA